MDIKKNNPEIVVISDVHLGTFGCHATELLQYLKSINPTMLILNGDIIDGWQFSKHYFPASHMLVIKELLSFVTRGIKVVYITGNHDEFLRRYSNFNVANFSITDKFLLNINGEKTWFFHGDIFDASTNGSLKFIAKIGGMGYDLLIVLNRFINYVLVKLNKEKKSFSKKVKNSVKNAIKWINDFEQIAAELAIENQYHKVVCGHIHQPQQRKITTVNGSVEYLNSGDWIENLTALEYYNNQWHIYKHPVKAAVSQAPVEKTKNFVPSILNSKIQSEFALFNSTLQLSH